MMLSVSSGVCTEWNLVIILLECHLVIRVILMMMLSMSSGDYI